MCTLVTKIQRPGEKKPAIPKDKPIHGLVSDKNFIVANAVENILAGKYLSSLFYVYKLEQYLQVWEASSFRRTQIWILIGIDGNLKLAVTLLRTEKTIFLRQLNF